MTSINAILTIALNTLRETVRDRVLYAFLIFAFILTLGAIILGSLSVGQNLRILVDLGLATISIFGGIIAIFVGTALVYKEIEKRTIYLIVTKPIKRWQFVLGKFCGLAICLFIVTILMGTFLLLLTLYMSPEHKFNLDLLYSIPLIYLELLFITAIATFFSTFATPMMSVVFTIGAWLIGHLGQSLLALAQITDSASLKMTLKTAYWIMPDLAQLTQVRSEITSGVNPGPELITYLVAYIMAYIVFLLALSTLITERREFS
ncbi:MAG: ABC transporter permease [Candidatus Obscuribacterales bacterium]|nr:ABC transporter permease [Candidatus Obscuribacterales bacterium]